MDVSFSSIPANLLVPLLHLEFGTGQAGSDQQNSLVIGQTITVQPAAAVFVSSVAQAIALFGANSMLAWMVDAYLAADPYASLYVLPLADANGAVAAMHNIAFTGTATAAGVLSLYINGKLVSVTVPLGTTAAQLAPLVVAAVNGWIDTNGLQMPVTAAVDATHTYQVNFTADNAGTLGNAIDIRLNYLGAASGEAVPAGLTAAVTIATNGATDPVLTGLDAVMGDQNYDFTVCPWATTTALDAVKTVMASRWAWDRMTYGHVFTAKREADATGTAAVTFGQGRNDPAVTCLDYEPSPSSPWTVAASYCGASAKSLRADPARPLQNLSLPGILAPAKGGRYGIPVQQTLLSNGLALMRYDADGTCRILRAVTTYKWNSAGAPDATYRDTEFRFTDMEVVRTLKNDVLTAFPRAKLADDGTSFGPGTTFTDGAPDQSITTPKGIKAEIVGSYSRMIERGLVEDLETFTSLLVVQRNSTDASRVDVGFNPIRVSGLRVMGVLARFLSQSPSAGSAA